MTHDNGEHRHLEPAFSPPVAALILGVVTTLGLFLALGNLSHKHRAKAAGSPPPKPTPTVIVPPIPSPTPTTGTAPTVPTRAMIRWRGTLTLSGYGDFKDLDSVPPRVDEKHADVRGDSIDPEVNAFGDVQIAQVGKRLLPATACGTAAYARGTDGTDPLTTGDVLCVATSGGHIARLQVIETHEGDLVQVSTFRVVVWNGREPNP